MLENTVRMSHGGWKLQFSTMQSALPPTWMHHPSTNVSIPTKRVHHRAEDVSCWLPSSLRVHTIKRCNDAHRGFDDKRGGCNGRSSSNCFFLNENSKEREVTSATAPPAFPIQFFSFINIYRQIFFMLKLIFELLSKRKKKSIRFFNRIALIVQ